jgi:hypothetical protein
MRKSGWDKRIFDLVQWDAHEKAFKRLPRFHQHSTSKLLHNLVNTNQQNHLFYGTSSLCPICQHAEETLQHVFTCNHSSVSALRTLCLDKMFRTIRNCTNSPTCIRFIKAWISYLDGGPNTSGRSSTYCWIIERARCCPHLCLYRTVSEYWMVSYVPRAG